MWDEGVRIYGTLEVPNNFPHQAYTTINKLLNLIFYINVNH